MKILLAAAALSLVCAAPVLAFDAPTTAFLIKYKIGKSVAISDVAGLMQSSERWCYREEGSTCAWSDIYLSVSDSGADYEIGNAWDETYDIAFTDKGVFKDNRYICENGFDWVPSVRATLRSDGSVVGGRTLSTLKAEIAAATADDTTTSCFDYKMEGADPVAETISLLQRQYVDGVYDPERDTPVTLHFDPQEAAALTWRW
jgi:hypothetical protein